MENYRLQKENRTLIKQNGLLWMKNQQLEDTFNKLLAHSVLQQDIIIELENKLNLTE